MDPAVLVDIESLKMDSPNVHTARRSSSETPVRIDTDFGSDLDGDIVTRTNRKNVVEGELDTLDEPIWDTIKRDLDAVWNKVYYAFLPMKNPKILLVEWDLWGALLFSTYIGLLLQHMNSFNPDASQFAQVIVVICMGTAAITYAHVVLLRTNTSIFQYISALGYCLTMSALYMTILYFLNFVFALPNFISLLLLVGCIVSSVYATSMILKPSDGPLNFPYHTLPIIVYYCTLLILITYHTWGLPTNRIYSQDHPPLIPIVATPTPA